MAKKTQPQPASQTPRGKAGQPRPASVGSSAGGQRTSLEERAEKVLSRQYQAPQPSADRPASTSRPQPAKPPQTATTGPEGGTMEKLLKRAQDVLNIVDVQPANLGGLRPADAGGPAGEVEAPAANPEATEEVIDKLNG